jgi:hypothetical protein
MFAPLRAAREPVLECSWNCQHYCGATLRLDHPGSDDPDGEAPRRRSGQVLP